MQSSESLSSGFIGSDFPEEEPMYTDIKPFFTSKNGYSQLYSCRIHGKIHILKGLKPLYRNQKLFRQLLQKEFEIGYSLDHPNIAKIIAMNELPEIGPCILMEYIDGITLRNFLSQNKLTGKNAHKIISDICHALSYVHSKQIIHRDLKPENILITHNGQNVKLIDFGLADSDDYDILKIPAGTKRYIAPEQSDKNCTLDNRADIFSLGIIIDELNEKLHNMQLKKIAKRCTEPDRSKRFDSVGDILQELDGTDIAKRLWIVITVVFAAIAIAFALYLSFRSAPAPLPEKSTYSSDTLHHQQTPPEIITEEELRSVNR